MILSFERCNNDSFPLAATRLPWISGKSSSAWAYARPKAVDLSVFPKI